MAASPSFIGAPRIGSAHLSAANTARDGSGTITTLLTGVAAGTRVLEIVAKAAATSAASVINIFLSTDNGATWLLHSAMPFGGNTADDTNDSSESSLTFDNLTLTGTSCKIGVTSTIAQPVNVFAFGGDL